MLKRSSSRRYAQPKDAPTGIQIRTLIIQILVGATDAGETEWADKVGAIETTPVSLNRRSNWIVNGRGSGEDRLAVDTAAEIVRQKHPYVQTKLGFDADVPGAKRLA